MLPFTDDRVRELESELEEVRREYRELYKDYEKEKQLRLALLAKIKNFLEDLK